MSEVAEKVIGVPLSRFEGDNKKAPILYLHGEQERSGLPVHRATLCLDLDIGSFEYDLSLLRESTESGYLYLFHPAEGEELQLVNRSSYIANKVSMKIYGYQDDSDIWFNCDMTMSTKYISAGMTTHLVGLTLSLGDYAANASREFERKIREIFFGEIEN